MAVIRYGAIVQDAQGSIGGITFARNHGTSCIRQRPLKTNSRTRLQEEARRAYAFVTASWSVLTDDERQTWIAGASKGNQSGAWGVGKQLSGFQLFVRENLKGGPRFDSLITEWFPVAGLAPLMTAVIQVLPGGPLRLVQSLYDPGFGCAFAVRAMQESIGRAGRARSMWRGLGTVSPVAQAVSTFRSGYFVRSGLEANARIRWEINAYHPGNVGGALTAGESVCPNISHAMNVNGGFEDTSVGPAPLGWTYTGPGVFRWQSGGQWCDDRCAYWHEPVSGVTGQANMQVNGRVVAGHRYRLNFWAGNASGGVSEVFLYESNGNHLELSAGFTPPAAGYAEFTFEAVATVDSVDPVVVWQRYGGAAQTVYLDECYFTEVYG